jgi:hypothetical protein
MRCEVWARQHAINKPAINNEDAINKVEQSVSVAINTEEVSQVQGGPDVSGVSVPADRTPNRRRREDYNAYMREYMKRKRSGPDQV